MSPIDVIDIFVVAGLVYSMLLGLRNSQTRLVAAGILAISVFYLLALTIGLRLASFLFNAVFTVLVLALVIVFQKELREYFQWVTRWILRLREARDAEAPKPLFVDMLAQTIAELAEQRTGALIILPGRDSLADFLVGGHELDGDASEPLIRSIFDPHSPGHDGALVIQREHVVRFGCHLPLSSDVEKLEGRGTRHAAALGLTELTDAMCIVVSEERGTISVARDSTLTVVSGERLRSAITDFLAAPGGAENGAGIGRLIIRQVPLQAAALIIASALWFVVVHEAAIEYRTFSVPVTLVGDSARRGPMVRVVVSGSRRNFYFVDSADISLTVPLIGYTPGHHEITLTASDISAPPSLQIVNIFPRTIEVTIDGASPR